jgi:hypothetical protein
VRSYLQPGSNINAPARRRCARVLYVSSIELECKI